jgi:hypothetical protein
MKTESPTHNHDELLTVASNWLVGGGVITVALAPLAIPILALTAVALLPLLLIPLAAALAIAVVAIPIVLGRGAIRALRRRRGGRVQAA